MSDRPRLFLIDGYSLLFRAYLAYGAAAESLRTRDGRPTGAVHGFASMLLTLIEKEKPEALYVAWDAPGPTFRDELYGDYKATRPETAPDLKQQFPLAREVADAMAIPSVEAPGFEADDILGTLAALGVDQGYEVLIVTGDSDQLQLVRDHVTVRMTLRGVSDTLDYDAARVREKYGIGPEQVAAFKALVGDKSDNVPGVPGIGAVTAAKLLREHGDIETLLASVDALPERTATDRRVRQSLRDHAETARSSLRLTTICCATPAPDRIARYAPDEASLQRARALFSNLEFARLAQRLPVLGATSPPIEAEKQVPTVWEARVVESAADLTDLVAWAAREDAIGVCAVISATAPTDRRLDGLAVAGRGHGVWYVRVASGPGAAGMGSGLFAGDAAAGVFEASLDALRPMLEGHTPLKAVPDLKSLAACIGPLGVALQSVDFDPGLAAYLLRPGRGSETVDELAVEFLGAPPTVSGVDGRLAGAARDAVLALMLRGPMRERLRSEGLLRIYDEIELPLAPVLARMEAAGILVDRSWLAQLSDRMKRRLDEAAERIYEIAGERFLINSTQQLQRILFDKLGLPSGKKTKTGRTTGADHLEALAAEHPIAGLVLEYREAAKLKSTYADALPKLIDSRTGRIHTTLNQTVTATGRLSSSDPNLQNIPVRSEIGREIRKAFVAPRGKQLLSCDYSQIELRVFAHVTGDPEMTRAFEADEDIHAATATRLFGVGLDGVTSDMRRRAKTVNFAVIYGQSDFGLAQSLGIPVGEARRFIDAYFAQFPGVRVWSERVLAEARERGYVETLFGRRRYVPDLVSGNYNVRQAAERAAVNMPIQGSAADIMKLAMLAVDRDCAAHSRPWRLLLQVHDELVLEVDEGSRIDAAERVRELMQSAADLSVVLKVEAKAGGNWADMVAL